MSVVPLGGMLKVRWDRLQVLLVVQQFRLQVHALGLLVGCGSVTPTNLKLMLTTQLCVGLTLAALTLTFTIVLMLWLGRQVLC